MKKIMIAYLKETPFIVLVFFATHHLQGWRQMATMGAYMMGASMIGYVQGLFDRK